MKTTQKTSAQPGDSPDFFTLAELAARWKCHVQTVRHTIQDGRLKVLRLGKSVRISRSEVERLEGEGPL